MPDQPDTSLAPDHEQVCDLPHVPERTFDTGFDPRRASAILMSDKKWVNGTQLRFCLMEQPAISADAQVVRDSFQQWQDLPLGLTFKEVTEPGEAEIRITFANDGSWSYVGRDALRQPSHQATMNFGWTLSRDSHGRDTALHEIGHALGLPHEHQNPNAGIQWNEPAVLARFSAPPNSWSHDQIRWNILRKIDPDTVQGSEWDPDSVMHYQFSAGLINVPEKYKSEPLLPEAGLSDRDREWAKTFYPPGPDTGLPTLEPFQSRALSLGAGEQANFAFEPATTREFDVGTFGDADTVMVVFEDVTTGPEELRGLRFLAGDDDSGTGRNAHVTVRLRAGMRYVVRLRLYWPSSTGQTAIMLW